MKSKTVAVALAVASSLVGVNALAEGKYGIFPPMGENFIENKLADDAEQKNASTPIKQTEKVVTEEMSFDKLPATSVGHQDSRIWPKGYSPVAEREREVQKLDLDKLPATSAGPALTREDVMNEYLRAKEAGTLPPIPYGGDSSDSSDSSN